MSEPARTAAPEPRPARRPGTDPAEAHLPPRLSGVVPVSATTVHGRASMAFGALFLAAGTFVALCAFDVIATPDSSYHVSRALVAAIGILYFALPGALFVVHGLRGLLRERRRLRARREHAGRPWRGDHPWDPSGETHLGLRPALQRVKGVLVMGAFLAPFHWLVIELDGAWGMRIAIGVFDLLVLLLAADAVRSLAGALRHGRSELRWSRFPCHPGETLDLELRLASRARFQTLTFTLRCVQEAYETRGSGKSKEEVVNCYALHEDERVVTRDELGPGGAASVMVSFLVPADAPGTELSARPPRYWHVHVEGKVRGPDFEDTFLVPVYDRS